MEVTTDKNPDRILQFIKSEERKTNKGKFRIFFGMAAGVGKTYAMLQSAHRLKNEGVDVVIGYIETHKRKETEALLDGLEIIPRLKMEHRGSFVEEMDLDAIIERKPQVILVDELAHTNTSGMRHPKRYMDVLEIIDHGISVFSTLNVQHLESQADLAFKISGIPVRETLPDSVLDRADDIKLMDLMPDELLKRLEEGKVYTEEKVAMALENFFKKENLTALREMALHYTARKVEHELDEYRKLSHQYGQMNEKLMVCVSSSPDCAAVIKWTRRIAFSMKIDWIAVYVDNGKKIPAKVEEKLHENLELARKLGAETIVTADESVVKGIIRLAQERNITQLVMGRSPERKGIFPKPNLMETLIKVSPGLHISVISHEVIGSKSQKYTGWFNFPISTGIREYVYSLSATFVFTILAFFARDYLGYRAISILFLIFVLLQSLYLGRGPVFLSAILSVLFFNYLFIKPYYTFRIATPEDLLMFLSYIIAAIVTGHFASKMRSNDRILRKREKRLWSLYDLVQNLSKAGGLDEIITIAINHTGNFFKVKACVILAEKPDGWKKMRLMANPHPSSHYEPTTKEIAVANWVFENGRPAGKFTDTLPLSESIFYPLPAPGGIMGVLGIVTQDRLTLGQDALLKIFASQIGIALERKLLADESQKSVRLEESDRMYKTIFNLLSHELKTPLTILNMACENLDNQKLTSDESTRRAVIKDIEFASRRLNRLVENLLDMSRFESGMFKLNKNPAEVGELIDSAKKDISQEFEGDRLIVRIQDNLPAVNIDFVLMQRSLVNLIVNAIQVSPGNQPVRIEAFRVNDTVAIRISDNGPGIHPDDMPYIFEKFNKREGRRSKSGIGLGLSIVKSVIDAHDGRIDIETRITAPDTGTAFSVFLPILEYG